MATKSKPKTKSRTSKSKLNKKVHFPLWALIVGILVIAGVGIFLVYNSFASSYTVPLNGNARVMADMHCDHGNCHRASGGEKHYWVQSNGLCGTGYAWSTSYSKSRWICESY